MPPPVEPVASIGIVIIGSRYPTSTDGALISWDGFDNTDVVSIIAVVLDLFLNFGGMMDSW